MLGLFKNKVIEKPYFYDLAFTFEVNGYTEIEANNICDFIDSKGRAPLVVRKTIGRIVNRKEMAFKDLELLYKACKHFELDEINTDMPNHAPDRLINYDRYLAAQFLSHLLLKTRYFKRGVLNDLTIKN